MICAAQFLFAYVSASVALHLITYLIGIGYTAGFAAKMMSLVLMIAGLGKLLMGVLADRVSARRALAFNFLAAAIGIILMFGASRPVLLVPFVIDLRAHDRRAAGAAADAHSGVARAEALWLDRGNERSVPDDRRRDRPDRYGPHLRPDGFVQLRVGFVRYRVHSGCARDTRLPLAGVRAIAPDANRGDGDLAADRSATAAFAIFGPINAPNSDEIPPIEC